MSNAARRKRRRKALPESFRTLFDRHGIPVSRETAEKLAVYKALLLKWQRAINLVGPATLDDVATRHFLDSAQLWPLLAGGNVRLADLGAGAGFPGLVLAILGVRDVHLVESDIRKATFLREVSRETNTPVTVHDVRIEDCGIEGVDVFTARALAPLRDLLGHIDGLSTEGHPFHAFFLKGAQAKDEISKAKSRWIFDAETRDSITDPDAKIIKISNLVKK